MPFTFLGCPIIIIILVACACGLFRLLRANCMCCDRFLDDTASISLESKGPNLSFDCLPKQKGDAFDFVFGRYHVSYHLTLRTWSHGPPP